MLADVEMPSAKAIVIVDDEKSFTDLLGRLLAEHFSCPIITFSTPLALLEKLPTIEIGILVTDYYMPHLNGLDLMRQIGCRCEPAPPCILITGHAFERNEDEERDLPHFRDVLPKPFRWQQIAAMITQNWPASEPSPLRSSATDSAQL